MSDGFLGRWSRRKQESRAGAGEAAAPPAKPVAQAVAPSPPTAPPVPAAAAEPAPTLAEAQALTPASDFSRFASRAVAPEVRNAAMKQLFRDPHFNVMDGLDTYIGDYSGADPVPLAILRKLASAQFLGLVQPEEETQAVTAQDAAAQLGPEGKPGQDSVAADVAQLHGNPPGCEEAVAPPALPPATASETPYAHAHLRLQPDHAPPDASSGGGDR